MMNKAIAKYRKEGCLGEWFLTDFTMEQVEGRIENLEEEVKRLRKELGSANDAIVLLKTRLKQLQKAVEIEHDQGESFLTQIKELREENERLQAELDGFIHGGL